MTICTHLALFSIIEQKNQHKAKKGHKGQYKGRIGRFWIFCSLVVFSWPFDVNLHRFWIFLSFKAVKAKKATLVAGIANFHIGASIFSNILSYHPRELFNVFFVLGFLSTRPGLYRYVVGQARLGQARLRLAWVENAGSGCMGRPPRKITFLQKVCF